MEPQVKSFAGLLYEVDAFHDEYLGSCTFDERGARLTIEEHGPERKPHFMGANSGPAVAHIRAIGVSDLRLSLDMILPCFIYEVREPEPGQLEFDLNNGFIGFKAEKIDIQLYQ